MQLLTPIGALLWTILAIVVASYFFRAILIARGRAGLRSIEKTHYTDPDKNCNEFITLESCPNSLQRFIAKHQSEILTQGFTELLTGRRMQLKEGRCNSHYQVLVSGDKSTIVEFIHVRVPRVISLWPTALPFSNLIGPSVLTYTFESIFPDGRTLITSRDPSLKLLDVPSVSVNLTPTECSFSEMNKSHKIQLDLLSTESTQSPTPFLTRESFFEKERVQRHQIAESQKRFMEKLREESMADIWDNKSNEN